MPTFNSIQWNGGQWNGPGTGGGDGVYAADIISDAMRIAGVTKWVGCGPGDEQATEQIRALNRIADQFNCQPGMIMAKQIQPFSLVVGQQTYTIGPGGDWDTVNPQVIERANAIISDFRTPMKILTDDEWMAIQVQNASGSYPMAIYNDRKSPLSTIYIYFIPSAAASVELLTYVQIPWFNDLTDIAFFPQGFQQCLTLTLAVETADLNPYDSKMNADVRRRAIGAQAIVANSIRTVNRLRTDVPASDLRSPDWRIVNVLGPWA